MEELVRIRFTDQITNPSFRRQTMLYQNEDGHLFGIQIKSDHTLECIFIPREEVKANFETVGILSTNVTVPISFGEYLIRDTFRIVSTSGFMVIAEPRDCTSPSVLIHCSIDGKDDEIETRTFSIQEQVVTKHNYWDSERKVLWIMSWQIDDFRPVMLGYDIASLFVENNLNIGVELKADIQIDLPYTLMLPQIRSIYVNESRLLITYRHTFSHIHACTFSLTSTSPVKEYHIVIPKSFRRDLLCYQHQINAEVIMIVTTRNCLLFHFQDENWSLIDVKSFPLMHTMSRMVNCERLGSGIDPDLYPKHFIVSSSLDNMWIISITKFDKDGLPMISFIDQDLNTSSSGTVSEAIPWHASGIFDVLSDISSSDNGYYILESGTFSELRLSTVQSVSLDV